MNTGVALKFLQRRKLTSISWLLSNDQSSFTKHPRRFIN